jgi:hypothetical protein
MAATADVEVEAMLLFPHISLRPGLPQAQEGGRHGGHGGRRGGGHVTVKAQRRRRWV